MLTWGRTCHGSFAGLTGFTFSGLTGVGVGVGAGVGFAGVTGALRAGAGAGAGLAGVAAATPL